MGRDFPDEAGLLRLGPSSGQPERSLDELPPARSSAKWTKPTEAHGGEPVVAALLG
jgi:hypothetical protein